MKTVIPLQIKCHIPTDIDINVINSRVAFMRNHNWYLILNTSVTFFSPNKFIAKPCTDCAFFITP